MQSIREVIRAILRDDALYKRKDLPGDVDDPPSSCGCKGSCDSCSGEDYVTPKYALYSMIGDAISIYDEMESDEFGDDEVNDLILSTAQRIRSLKH